MLDPGQFKPTDGANPAIGAVGTLEQVEEHRVEVLVKDEGKHEEIRGAVEELKKARPVSVARAAMACNNLADTPVRRSRI